MHDIFAKFIETVEIGEPKTTPAKTESSVPALVLSNAPEAYRWQHLPHLCVRHMPLSPHLSAPSHKLLSWAAQAQMNIATSVI